MSHLTTDRLAAVADDTPTADEATHIAGCWDCRAEVAAYRRLARLSAMAPLPTEPLTAWSRLAPQLRAEGIIVDAHRLAVGGGAPHAVEEFTHHPRVFPVPASRRRLMPVWAVRAAAGLALVLGGAAAGRVSAGLPLFGSSPVTAPAVAARTSFQSSDDAMRAMTVAQQQYQTAAAFLASQDNGAQMMGMNQDAYQTRLAALDEIAAAARTALYRTPQDPMLNQYYLTTLGAREATLRQIGATVPETRRLERY